VPTITRLTRGEELERALRHTGDTGGDSTESKQRGGQCDDHEKGSMIQHQTYVVSVHLACKLQDRKRGVCTLAHIRTHE
jgi:hypothetical protein